MPKFTARAILVVFVGGALKALMAMTVVSLILVACTSASPTPTPTAKPAPPTPAPTSTSPPPTSTPGPDLGAILRQHYDLVNKGDVAAAVAVFTDDADMLRGACSTLSPCKTRADVQRQIQREMNGQSRFNIISVTASGSNLSARVEQRNPTIQGAGIERVIFRVTATFIGDRISRIVHEIDASDAQSAQFSNFNRVSSVSNARITAFRRADLAAMMSFFVDDAIFQGFGLCAASPCSGKAAIQKEMERQLADHVAGSEVTGSARVTGDTLVFRAELRSDSIKAAGVERILVTTTTEVKGDKIVSLRYVLDSSDAQTATYLKSQGK